MHVMIDLETMGLEADAAILQIAAVEFEPVHGGKIYVERAFNCYTTIESQPERKIDSNTLMWWMSQDEVARGHIIAGQESGTHISVTLDGLAVWCMHALTEVDKVWAKGTDFDIAILNHVCAEFHMPSPWSYRQPRDLRTYLDFYPFSSEDAAIKVGYRAEKCMNEVGTEWLKHDALSDCVLQICQFQEVTP